MKVEKLSKKVTAKTFFKIFLVSILFFLVSILFKKVREEKGGGGGGVVIRAWPYILPSGLVKNTKQLVKYPPVLYFKPSKNVHVCI